MEMREYRTAHLQQDRVKAQVSRTLAGGEMGKPGAVIQPVLHCPQDGDSWGPEESVP